MLFCVCINHIINSQAADGNLRTDRKPLDSSSKRTSAISVASILSSNRRLPGRRLQEKSFLTESFLPHAINLMGKNFSIVSNVASNFNRILQGRRRQSKRRLGGGSIPSVGTVLDHLNSGREALNGLQLELNEVTSVLSNLPLIGQAFSNLGGLQMNTKFNLLCSGIFGIKGLLRTLMGGLTQFISGVFESALFSRFAQGWHNSNILGLVADPKLSKVEFNQQAAILAEKDAHLLGAQLDALTTAFSGGVQIPLTKGLREIQSSFLEVIGNPSDASVWTKAVISLQQLKESLSRLSLVWNLDMTQQSTVDVSVNVVDKLLAQIGSNTGMIDVAFFNDLSSSLQILGNSILRLDNTSLVPKVSLNGLDISNQLLSQAKDALSVLINLSEFGFLKNAFGVTNDVIENALPVPVQISKDAMGQIYTISSESFFSDLLLGTFESIPSLLSQAVYIEDVISSVSYSLLASLQTSNNWKSSWLGRIGGALNSTETLGGFVSQLLQEGDPSQAGVIGFAKLLQLDGAKNTAQSLTDNLGSVAHSLTRLIPAHQIFDNLLENLIAEESSLTSNLMPKESATNVIENLRVMDFFNRNNRRLQEQPSLQTESVLVSETSAVVDFIVTEFLSSCLQMYKVIDDIASTLCLSGDQLEAIQTVRAAALIGNPIDVMLASETPDATIIEVLSSSNTGTQPTPEETHSTQIGLASCEEKRSNLKKLQNMFDKFFDDVAPALVAVLSVEDPSDDIRFPALSLET